jgi:hypothetical protein
MTGSDRRNILLIEKLSLSNLIYLLVTGNANRESYFVYLDTIVSRLAKIPFFLKIQKKIIKKIEYADLPGSYFAAEEEGYQTAVDSIFDKNADNLFLRIAIKYCKDPLYRLALKKEFYNRYSQRRVKTFTILKYLSERFPDVPITFIPSDNEAIISSLSPRFITRSSFTIPPSVTILNHIRSWTKTALILCLFPVFLIIITAGYALRGFDGKPCIKNYDFGFDNFNTGINFKNPYEFFFLFDFKKLHPKKTLQVVRNKFETGENGSKTRLFFERLGYPYVEHDKVRVPLGFYVENICLEFLFGGLYAYAKNLFTSNWKESYVIPALAVMKMTIEAEIFYHQYDVRVFIARDEYSPFHIVRTLVARAHGNATIGFSHGDDCHHTAALNYLVFDKYAVWGEYYRDYLKKSLQHSDTAVIGAGIYGLDKTFCLQSRYHVPFKYRTIKNDFKLIGIFASSFTPELYITRERTLHFYKTVLDLTDNYSEYYRVIKPKGDEFSDPEFQELLKNRKRVIIEDTMWTYHLLSCLDALICINITTIGLEGLMAGKKVFYYDVTNNKNHHVYARYSEDLVAFDGSTLRRNLERYFNEGRYISPERIREILDYHGFRFDGNVVKRLRTCCFEQLNQR